MARARNIKPGFFRNADLVELPMEARLLFIGLWTLADREGRLEDRPKQIKMEIFPADSVDCDVLLVQLASTGMVARYEVDGKRYLQVVNFTKHQNPHRDEKASTVPDQEGNLATPAPAPKKHGANTVQAPDKDGANTVAIGLNPDPGFLIPDSPTETAGKPAAPAKPAPVSRGDKTLKTYIAECKAAGEKPIPEGHYVRTYCRDAGITDDMAAIAWLRFREDHTIGTRKAKRYTDWPAAFANSVKDRWYRLWLVNPEGEANWTNEGLQARRVTEASQREAEVSA